MCTIFVKTVSSELYWNHDTWHQNIVTLSRDFKFELIGHSSSAELLPFFCYDDTWLIPWRVSWITKLELVHQWCFELLRPHISYNFNMACLVFSNLTSLLLYVDVIVGWALGAWISSETVRLSEQTSWNHIWYASGSLSNESNIL